MRKWYNAGMKVKQLHGWDLNYGQARELQKKLAAKVKFSAIKKPIKLIAGLDCAFGKKTEKEIITCAAVVLSWPELEVVETVKCSGELKFPYVPGLLSFREGPVCLETVEKLQTKPDVFMIDGQGIAHQRRLGLAAHLGLFFDKPTIGCAKSRLTGTFEPVGIEKGNYSWLKDGNEIIGAVTRTRTNVKPIFVSVGHKCLLTDAIELVLSCSVKYRLPEPTRLADKLSRS